MTPTKIIGDRNRKSCYNPDLARIVNEEAEEKERKRRMEELRRKKAGLPPAEEPDTPPAPGAGSSLHVGKYILMPRTSTYALGLHDLQEQCQKENNSNHPQIVLSGGKKIYRANTFLENILARMNDWETLRDPAGNERTLEDRKRYFVTWLDSSCGAAYKAKSTKLKLQLVCPQLMGIAKDFNEDFLPVDYASFKGIELDSNSRNFVRDGWQILLEDRTDVYRNYLEILKVITGKKIVPDFWKRKNTTTDELGAVYVDDLGSGSDASVLNDGGRFLRSSPFVPT